MKYKLKEHVTEQDLLDIGFVKNTFPDTYSHKRNHIHSYVLIRFKTKYIFYMKEEFIQDLIEKGYVEAVE